MTKKKTSRGQGLTLDDMVIVNLDKEKLSKLEEVNPEETFKDHVKVAIALLQSLLENDTEAFIEILDSYLRVNRTVVAKNANLSRATVQLAFSKKGNPTLKTLAKIVHHQVGSLSQSKKR